MARIPLNPDAQRILLRAEVIGSRGSRTVPLILDTGASFTMLPYEVVAAIGCDPTKAIRRIEIMTASTIEVVPVVVIPTMAVLGHSIRKLEVICHTLPSISPAEGLLGLNFLKHLDLHLNFRSGALELIA